MGPMVTPSVSQERVRTHMRKVTQLVVFVLKNWYQDEKMADMKTSLKLVARKL
jgi:hypothetical protein